MTYTTSQGFNSQSEEEYLAVRYAKRQQTLPPIMSARLTFEPTEYPKAEEFWLAQQQSHWLHTTINMETCKQDWHTRLNEAERSVISRILLGFTQTEVIVANYWSLVADWFPKPEIAAMAQTFAAWEGIHQYSYNQLSKVLGLKEHDVFVQDRHAAAKLEYLMKADKNSSPATIARSLAIFSAYAEGVSLFSAFAVLFSFGKRGLIKGVRDIISYSVRDESLHSSAGVWLFNQLCAEMPQLRDEQLMMDIYAAGEATLQLEENYVDMVFQLAGGEIPLVKADALKEYIKLRLNLKQQELGYKGLYAPDLEKCNTITSWFGEATAGLVDTDSFANRETQYTKESFNDSQVDISSLF